MKVIKTQNNLRNYLESLINETIDKYSSKNNLKEEDAKGGLNDDDSKEIKSGKINADTVIEKLNFIRSGRSFKDAEVKSGLVKYIDGLNDAEKTALLAFLKGISQVVTAEINPEHAIEPKDSPADISMEKKSKNVVKITPIVTKSGGSPSSEDASGPAPIQPKK